MSVQVKKSIVLFLNFYTFHFHFKRIWFTLLNLFLTNNTNILS